MRLPGHRIFVVLFFGVFLLAGGFLFQLMFIHPSARIVEAKQWQETPCRILRSEVRSFPGKKNTTTYRVEVRYSYTFDGRQFQSDRYDFAAGSSSGYEGKAAVVRRYPPGTETVCYVDPHAPHEAVIERRFTSEMLLGFIPLVFLFVGLGGVTFGLVAGKSDRQLRQEWATGRITASTKAGIIGLWAFTVVYNAIVWPAILFVTLHFVGSWQGPSALILAFPVAGLGLVGFATHRTMRWRKFGATVFEMESTPGVIGGELRGRILLGELVRPEAGCRVKLRCVHRFTTGSGKNRKTRENTLWEAEQETGAGMTDFIPVSIKIPPNCEPTRDTNPSDSISWRLEAKVKLPGVDYSAKFEVPVFAAGQRADFSA